MRIVPERITHPFRFFINTWKKVMCRIRVPFRKVTANTLWIAALLHTCKVVIRSRNMSEKPSGRQTYMIETSNGLVEEKGEARGYITELDAGVHRSIVLATL